MKKFLLILLAFFFGLTVQSQSKTFLGLTLGKAYTEQQVRSTIESNTKGYKIKRYHINGYIVFPEQLYGGIDDRKPNYLFSLTDNNVFKSIMITYNQGCGDLDSLYAHLADSLSTKYKMYSDSTIFSKSCVCLDADGMTVNLTKDDTFITLSYSDNNYKEEYKSLMDFFPKPPEIQDTFFGLKLGQKYTIPRIKVLIGTKGHGRYFNSERSATGMKVQFFDVSFAGKIWDICEIYVTENDEFTQFTIYDSLDNYSEEKKEAKEIYESYKKTIDKKYATDMFPFVNDEGEDISASYFGANKISLELYNRKGKSSSGSYRRYVGMQYSHYEILKTTFEANENEL